MVKEAPRGANGDIANNHPGLAWYGVEQPEAWFMPRNNPVIAGTMNSRERVRKELTVLQPPNRKVKFWVNMAKEDWIPLVQALQTAMTEFTTATRRLKIARKDRQRHKGAGGRFVLNVELDVDEEFERRDNWNRYQTLATAAIDAEIKELEETRDDRMNDYLAVVEEARMYQEFISDSE